MDSQQTVSEIKRLARENGGQPPERQAFENATGVKMSEWYPHTWLRWGDALAEAGYGSNVLQAKTSDSQFIEKYISFTRELGRFPVEGEIRRKAREDLTFHSHSAFRRFGGKHKPIDTLAAYCQNRSGYEDVLALPARHTRPHANPNRK